MKPLVTLACIILFVSCNQQQGQRQSSTTDSLEQDVSVESAKPEVKESALALLDGLTLKSFPYIDSTNFDNDDNKGKKDADLLKQIGFSAEEVNFKDVRFRYQLNYSKNFYSVVLTYPLGEHELITTLLNVDKKGRILDFLDIAYDEIAESAFRKESELKKEEVVLVDWNYMSEEPTKTVTHYRISDSGKFEETGD